MAGRRSGRQRDPVGAYVKRAPRPRATVLAQDIFGSGVVPSDTDYSVLGGDSVGGMTGMDLATMLGSGRATVRGHLRQDQDQASRLTANGWRS